jgi:hypothetical protein
MMEAASASETSVFFFLTSWRNIPDDSNFHLKMHDLLSKSPNQL